MINILKTLANIAVTFGESGEQRLERLGLGVEETQLPAAQTPSAISQNLESDETRPTLEQ